MESLLKMSGLLSDEDGGKTDLGTIEKRLVEKVTTAGDLSRRDSVQHASSVSANHTPDSQHSTPQHDVQSTPRTSIASPGSENLKEKDKSKEEEVEVLSDMMCSLVTNNCGESRYIGMKEGTWHAIPC